MRLKLKLSVKSQLKQVNFKALLEVTNIVLGLDIVL